MNKLFVFVVVASVIVASLSAHPLNVDEDVNAHHESLHGPPAKGAVRYESVNSQPKYTDSYYLSCSSQCKLNGSRGGSYVPGKSGKCSCF